MPDRAQPPAGVVVAMARQGLRDARTRTITFAYLFAIYGYVQATGYRNTYSTAAERLSFAHGFGANKGLRLLYGRPYDLVTVEGYCAWRVGGVLALAGAAFGLLAAVRALRTEEETGRAELVLAAAVTRRSLHLAATGATAVAVAGLWLAEFAGLVAGGLPVAGSAYLSLAAAAVAAVFAGVGAVASQIAPTRRSALGGGAAVLAVAFALRVLADTVDGIRWLSWLTPLGWAEQLRPFTGARPAVLLLFALATGILGAIAARLAAGRDVGTGVLPARDEADPRPRLLGSTTTFALRMQRAGLLTWVLTVAGFSFILGSVSNSISTADVSESIQKQLAKLGAGSIFTPTGYLGFVFLFVVVAVTAYGCSLVGAVRQEESAQQLETTLAQPVGRTAWLVGRLAVALGAVAAVAVTAGLATWLGARAAGVRIALPRMLEAGLNALPVTVLFLGIAVLAYALVPRASGAIAYGLLAVAFLWQMVGSLLEPPRWLLDLTPFGHVAAVPAAPFAVGAAAVMVVLGLTAGGLGVVAFRRRDLVAD